MVNKKKLSDLERIRIEKIGALKALGIEPYPGKAERSHTNDKAIALFESIENNVDSSEEFEVSLVGRLRSIRSMGKIVFAHIEDGTAVVQLFLRKDNIGSDQLQLFKDNFDLGDFVGAKGSLFRTKTGEISLNAKTLTMLSKAVLPLPAAKDEEKDGEIIRHGALTDPETRYRQRYAD